MSKMSRAIEIYKQDGLSTFIDKSINFLQIRIQRDLIGPPISAMWRIERIDRYAFKSSVERLNRRQNQERNIDDIIDTAIQYTGRGFYDNISPIQHPVELRRVAEVVADLDPDTIVEIGTDRGGTLYVWSRCTDPDSIVSIDTDFSILSGSSLLYENRKAFMSNFDDTQFQFLERNSQCEATANAVIESADSSGIDFIFIDGDHTYEGVKRDFELYEAMVNQGGMIALHDIKNRKREFQPFGRKYQTIILSERFIHRKRSIHCLTSERSVRSESRSTEVSGSFMCDLKLKQTRNPVFEQFSMWNGVWDRAAEQRFLFIGAGDTHSGILKAGRVTTRKPREISR